MTSSLSSKTFDYNDLYKFVVNPENHKNESFSKEIIKILSQCHNFTQSDWSKAYLLCLTHSSDPNLELYFKNRVLQPRTPLSVRLPVSTAIPQPKKMEKVDTQILSNGSSGNSGIEENPLRAVSQPKSFNRANTNLSTSEMKSPISSPDQTAKDTEKSSEDEIFILTKKFKSLLLNLVELSSEDRSFIASQIENELPPKHQEGWRKVVQYSKKIYDPDKTQSVTKSVGCVDIDHPQWIQPRLTIPSAQRKAEDIMQQYQVLQNIQCEKEKKSKMNKIIEESQAWISLAMKEEKDLFLNLLVPFSPKLVNHLKNL